MKSYFLSPIASASAAQTALTRLLPHENQTWLLKDSVGDVMAYFAVVGGDNGYSIQADISGRHYSEDAKVCAVLEKLRSELGGQVEFEP